GTRRREERRPAARRREQPSPAAHLRGQPDRSRPSGGRRQLAGEVARQPPPSARRTDRDRSWSSLRPYRAVCAGWVPRDGALRAAHCQPPGNPERPPWAGGRSRVVRSRTPRSGPGQMAPRPLRLVPLAAFTTTTTLLAPL